MKAAPGRARERAAHTDASDESAEAATLTYKNLVKRLTIRAGSRHGARLKGVGF
jgi:hypothetical protein